MSDDPAADVQAYVTASMELMALPLSGARRTIVETNLLRIASFAAHVGAVELSDEVEIAGDVTL